MFGRKNRHDAIGLIFTQTHCHVRLREAGGIRPPRIPASDFNSIPLDVLEMHGIRNCAESSVVVPADILQVTVESDKQMEFEDMLAAVAWECSSASGVEPEEIRPVFLRAEQWHPEQNPARSTQMPDLPGPKHYVAASIPKASFANFATQFAHAGVQLKGISSLQMLVCAWHLKNSRDRSESLIFVLEKNSLAFMPPSGGKGMILRNLPFGHTHLKPEEMAERLGKRLPEFQEKALRLLVVGDEQDGLAESIAEALKTEKARESKFEECLDELFDILDSARTNRPDSDFALAAPEPPKRDPRTTGTYICVAMIAATILALAVQFVQLHAAKRHISSAIAEEEKLIARKNTLTAEIKNSRREISACRETVEFLENSKRVPPDLMAVLGLLSRYRLRYTRINRIAHDGARVSIDGETLHQKDLALFISDFHKRLSGQGLTLLSEGLKRKKDGEEMSFRCVVTAGGG